jgi:hypothetical protein
MYIAFDSEVSHIGIRKVGFVARVLPNGNHVVRAGISGIVGYPSDWSEGHSALACVAGETLFFELYVKEEWEGLDRLMAPPAVLVIKVLPVAASSARSDIADRRLILSG